MNKIIFLLLLVVSFLLSSFLTFSNYSYAQQPTFGPVCEEGTTCTPTQQPPTATSQPTSQPTSTTAPPVAGSVDNSLAILGIGAVLLVASLSGFVFVKSGNN